MKLLSIKDLDLSGKRVLIRADFNVPIQDGQVSSDTRIRASIPTIRWALDHGAQVMVCSHLGRPVPGRWSKDSSLMPVVSVLSEYLGCPVRLQKDYLDGVELQQDEVVLLENVRFNVGETDNDSQLAHKLANLCDVFVMDAFGAAHRAHASTVGVIEHAKEACAGVLMASELQALSKAMDAPTAPVVAIVGGSKVSTKFSVLSALKDKVDQLIVGGGIANTFIAATGHDVGNSLYEPDWIDSAKRLIKDESDVGGFIPLPTDVVVAKEFSAQAQSRLCGVEDVQDDDMILDIGPDTAGQLASLLQDAGTIVWNGPVGVFEIESFSEGTRVIAEAIAESSAFSLAGGGDTLAAIEQFQVGDKIDYISTGGGAFLEYLEGKLLPAVEALYDKQSNIK